MHTSHSCHCHEQDAHRKQSHEHHHVPPKGEKLLIVTLLNALITAVEIVGGLLSNSLSLLSDAVHNLGDTLAIAFAYIARRIGNKQADMRHTFGYKRTEILAAFVNASMLMAICLFLLKEAYERSLHPEQIQGKMMLIVAVVAGGQSYLCAGFAKRKGAQHEHPCRLPAPAGRHTLVRGRDSRRNCHLAVRSCLAGPAYYGTGQPVHPVSYVGRITRSG